MKRLDIIATCIVLSFLIFSTEAQFFPNWFLPQPQKPYIPQYPPQIFEPQHVPQVPQNPYEPQIPQQQYDPQGPGSNMQSDCSNCVCGVNKRSRIVGGSVTDISNYPWMVRMLVMTKGGELTVCGASLISSKYILTAAHCVDGKPPGQFIIRLADRSEHRARRIIRHEYYSKSAMDNDIAMIELQRPVKLGNGVNTVCLPKSGTDYHNYVGKQASVIGYGMLSEHGTDYSEKPLSKVDVPILSLEQCRARSQYATNGKHITNNMICAGDLNGGRDSCQGDSGGPMFVKGARGESIQAGVVSFGIGCARPGFPGIYTNVGNYHDWIQRNMHGDCLCPSP